MNISFLAEKYDIPKFVVQTWVCPRKNGVIVQDRISSASKSNSSCLIEEVGTVLEKCLTLISELEVNDPQLKITIYHFYEEHFRHRIITI